MNPQSIPPGTMFRSFLTVASAYVMVLFLLIGTTIALGAMFFPEFMAFFEMDEVAQKRMMAEDPKQAIPIAMFWSIVVVNVLTCFGVGVYVVKTAPFASFAHAVFLAVLLFVYFLQIVIQDPAAKKWMDIVYMGAFPIAVLYGAKWALERESQSAVGSESSVSRDDDEP